MVNTSCAVYRCGSTSHRHKGVKFHQFPKDERLQQWIKACKRPDLAGKDQEQLKNMHVCSLHFEQRMYGKLLLKKCAVPTINLPDTATNSVYTQTDYHHPAALQVLTSQAVQTDEELSFSLSSAIMKRDLSIYPIIADREIKKLMKRRPERRHKIIDPISIDQFLNGCDLFLPVTLSNFVKAHILTM